LSLFWPRLAISELRFVFAKRGAFGSFWAPICTNLRAKRAEFAAIKKVMSFVLKHFLASFPLFFIFGNMPLFPRARTVPFSLGHRRARALACDTMSTT
jgi:hypothetical protein